MQNGDLKPFLFHTESRLVELTGLTAGNLNELLELLRTVSGSSVFYHTHQFFLEHHFVDTGFFNDFAKWVSDELREFELGEKLNYIDFAALKSVREIRNALCNRIENHIHEKEFRRQAPREETFHFCMSKSFVFPTGNVATNINEFREGLKTASNDSIFFHFVESRLRLNGYRFANDFSIWLHDTFGLTDLASELENIDPYFDTLETIRNRIVALLEEAM